jgi:hypothetical protein
MPPFEAIKSWVSLKVRKDRAFLRDVDKSIDKEKQIANAAWAIAAKIKRDGIKEFPVLQFVLDQNMNWIHNEIKKLEAEFS